MAGLLDTLFEIGAGLTKSQEERDAEARAAGREEALRREAEFDAAFEAKRSPVQLLDQRIREHYQIEGDPSEFKQPIDPIEVDPRIDEEREGKRFRNRAVEQLLQDLQ